MSTNKPPKKKVVVTTGRKTAQVSRSSSQTTSSRASRQQEEVEMIFEKQNFLWMGIGAGVMLLGFLLMVGGEMPGPDVWDDSVIYHWRRTLLAPFVILVGIGIEIYAIFKK